MQKKIIELLTAEPKLMANQIAHKLQYKPNSVKVVLLKMIGKEKVVREKVEREVSAKSGPKTVYAYSVKQ